MKKKRRIGTMLLCFALAASLAACTNEPAQASNTPGAGNSERPSNAADSAYAAEIVIGLPASITTIDPNLGTGTVNGFLYAIVYDSLLKFNTKTMELEPELVTEWKWTDDTYTAVALTLRDDVYFHNGEKMTAEDVKFSLDRATNTNFSNVYDRCEIVDDTHVTVYAATTDVDFLNILSITNLSVVCKSAVEADPLGSYIGTGPWVIDNVVEGDSVEFVRNENYWGEVPKTEKLSFCTYADESARLVALQNGELDFITKVSANDRGYAMEDDSITLYEFPSSQITFLALNCAGALSDINLRRAIACCVNREDMIMAVGDEGAVPSYTFMADNMAKYQETDFEEDLSYNLDKAREYLAQVPGDTSLTIKVLTANGYDTYYQPTLLLQSECAKIGVTLNLEPVDAPGMASEMTWGNADGYGIMINGLSFASWPSTDRAFFLSGSNSNLSQIADPDIAALFERGAKETDDAARVEIYKEIQRIAHDNVYYIPLFIGSDNVAYVNGISGMTIEASGAIDFSYINMPQG